MSTKTSHLAGQTPPRSPQPVGSLEVTFDQMHDALLVVAQMTVDLASRSVGRLRVCTPSKRSGISTTSFGRCAGPLQIRMDDPRHLRHGALVESASVVDTASCRAQLVLSCMGLNGLLTSVG